MPSGISAGKGITVFCDSTGCFMKKEMNTDLNDELRPEYDLSQLGKGVRGKYAERYQAGTNLVLLAPDVAEAFPTDEAVNKALRLLIRLAKTQLDPCIGSAVSGS